MQRGGGCRHRTGVLGKYGLVALRVLCRICVGDVGRQRHMAMAFHQRVGIIALVIAEHKAVQRAFRVGPSAQHRGAKAVFMACGASHLERSAHFGLFADAHMGGYLVAAQYAFNQQFHLTARGFFAKQAGVDDLGVVENQQVARLEQTGQLTEDAVHRT